MSAPRHEIAAEFRRLADGLPGGNLSETFTNDKRRQAFLQTNRQALSVLGIRTDRELQDIHNESQKGSFRKWIDEYVYSPDHPILGTFGKLITAKPVEGVINSIPFMPSIVGKAARWGTVATGGYFLGSWLLSLLTSGATAAYGGGDIILDRIGAGGGQLFPGMDLPPAAPYEQELPPVDPWENR